MTCYRVGGGFVCVSPVHSLVEHGARVWMEWHAYLGPTFYRSEACIKPIVTPSPKTWAAFNKWYETQTKARGGKKP